MLNFEEELQKFTPIMEVDDIEEGLYQEAPSEAGDASSARRQKTEREDERR